MIRIHVQDENGFREFHEFGLPDISDLPEEVQNRVRKHWSMANAYSHAERIHASVTGQGKTPLEIARAYGITPHFVKKITRLWAEQLPSPGPEDTEKNFNESPNFSNDSHS